MEAADNAHDTIRSTPGHYNIRCIDPPFQLKCLHYARRKCMPLIEWTCGAGFPTLLCLQIITDRAHHITPLLSSSSFDFVSEESKIFNIEQSLQWSLFTLIATLILSLGVILIFGDTHANRSDNSRREHNKRGTGVVVGSQLVPLLYMALLLSILPDSHDTEWKKTSSRQLLECSVVMHHNLLVVEISHHLKFALLGGFSFALSFYWVKLVSQYNHRKYKRRRACVDDENQSGLVSECSTSTMRICWKIYLSLISICVLRSNDELITFLLGMHHILLIAVYETKVHSTNRNGKASIDDAHWQDSFTPGEWMVVSTLITSLVGEFLLGNTGILHNFTSSQSSNTIPTHLVVAHAGLSGCLVGVSMCSIIKKWVKIFLFQSNSLMDHVKRGMVVAVSLIMFFGVAMGFIGVTLNAQSISTKNYCDYESTSFASFILSQATTSWRLIPLPIQWLLYFLLSNVNVPLFGDHTSLVRVAVLAYWFCIFAVCLPIALMLSSWIMATGGNNVMNINKNKYGERSRKQRTIIARKYFHLVAILLFTPITLLDPDMMSLSYAIAIALLIVIEMIRGLMGSNCIAIKKSRGDYEITKQSLTWNNFYMAFLDEKDASAANGGLAVTHIALIFGCAFPLWLNQWLQYAKGSTFQPDNILLALIPFLGIITLGVGDSISAIIGVNFGRLHWPGGSRTVEGSICMFLSMVCAVMFHVVFRRFDDLNSVELVVPLVVITLIEASTSQVDNLYLPLAGSSVVLLWTKYNER
jgi:dolichol kinase